MDVSVTESAYELELLAELEHKYQQHLNARSLAQVGFAGKSLDVRALELGNPNARVPTVLFVGGVHGVERIGSQVILALLGSLLTRCSWDKHLQLMLTQIRLAFVPVLNPIGLIRGTRANGNGVDLMRNAPIDARGSVTLMVGGQRLSRHLPWYRGRSNQLEAETRAIIDYSNDLMARGSSLIVLDAHSGFGLVDHIWFPFACKDTPFARLGEVYHLKQLFEMSYPHHCHYHIAPQSCFYRTHGDIWDYLVSGNPKVPFLPLTLEMGSWAWVKKNPRQLLRFSGYFNPQKQHRLQRILRRHFTLMQFLLDVGYAQVLEQLPELHRHHLDYQARNFWYPQAAEKPSHD